MNDYDYIKSLLIGSWDQVAVQGGELEYSPSKNNYLAFGLWIFRSSRWIEISAFPINHDDFRIAVSVLDYSPIPEPDLRNRPPRKPLRVFPDNCRLDKFIDGEVINVYAVVGDRYDDRITIDSPLVIEAGDDYRVAITVSDSYPGEIELRHV